MGEYRIELLLKINNETCSLFNSTKKIVELFKLNDKFKIYNVENERYYNLIFKNKTFRFFISMETPDIYSIAIHTLDDPLNNLVLTGVLETLTEVVREFKITISSNLKNCSYEVLWDDVGIYYAQLAYPKIIEIENLMRKLITKFMLVSVGMDFFNNIPSDINIRNDKDTDSGFLHNIDFIELAKYLFTARPLKKQEELMKVIDSLTENVLPPDIDLLNYKKDSYWNRYFKEKVGNGIEADSIKKDWEQLYKLRCKVAHSRFLKKEDLETIYTICNKLRQTFSEALEKLNNIHLTEEHKETITEDIFSEIEGNTWYEKLYELITRNYHDEFTLNDLYAFEPLLQEQYPENNTIPASIRRNLQKLRDNGRIEFIASGRYKLIEENNGQFTP